MPHEIPSPDGPHGDPQSDFGHLDPTSVPDAPGYIDVEAFRHRHISGYSRDIREARMLGVMARNGAIGGSLAYAGECIIDIIEHGTPAGSSLQTLIEIGHHTAHITAIIGGIAITSSVIRAAVRMRRVHKTYDVHGDSSGQSIQ